MRQLIFSLLIFLVSCGQKTTKDFNDCFDTEVQSSYEKLRASFQLSMLANKLTKDNQSNYQSFVNTMFDAANDSLDTIIEQFTIPSDAILHKSDINNLFYALYNKQGDFSPEGTYMTCINSRSNFSKRVISEYREAKEMGNLNFLIVASGIHGTASQEDYEDESVKAIILFEIYLELLK